MSSARLQMISRSAVSYSFVGGVEKCSCSGPVDLVGSDLAACLGANRLSVTLPDLQSSPAVPSAHADSFVSFPARRPHPGPHTFPPLDLLCRFIVNRCP